ncbi:MAG: hypothetical protein L3J59_08205 [Methylococcaceae bacterium]|nr:hypothetical protein [Methylococcaceae bacterium]
MVHRCKTRQIQTIEAGFDAGIASGLGIPTIILDNAEMPNQIVEILKYISQS